MDKVAPEHLHLLLDEPIYVLPDHGDHPLETVVAEEQPTYSGANNLGICIFLGDSDEEDLNFLFKGLNGSVTNHRKIR